MPTITEFKQRFIEGNAKANRQKPSGIANKQTYLRLYIEPLLGRKQLDEVRSEDVQRLKAVMQDKNAKTVNNAVTVLRKMLHVAAEWGVIDKVPVSIKLLKVHHKPIEFYEEEQFQRLVDAAAKVDPRANIVVLLGGAAGLRLGEMTALEWTDIVLDRRLPHVNRAEC